MNVNGSEYSASGVPPAMPVSTLPFLTGKQYREDELGEAAVRTANWRYCAFGAMALTGGLVALLFFVILLLAHKPLQVVEVREGSGDVRLVQENWKRYIPPETAYVAQLRQDIMILRTVTLDKEDMKRQHQAARVRMTKQAKELYAQYLQERKPLAQKEPVQIEILSVLHDSGLTWDVRWRETTYSHKIDIEHWRGKFTLLKGRPTGEELTATPLGIFLDHWSWGKE